MNKKIWVLLCASFLLVACDNTPKNEGNPESKPASFEAGAAAVETGEYTKVRQAAFDSMLEAWLPITKVVKGAEDFNADTFKAAVAKFSTDSQEPFKHFQQDQEGLNGNARPEIWANAGKFKEEEDKFRAAVEKLNKTAAKATDVAAVKADFGAVAASCGSCHASFKIDDQK